MHELYYFELPVKCLAFKLVVMMISYSVKGESAREMVLVMYMK